MNVNKKLCLEQILEKAFYEKYLHKEEILFLLSLSYKHEIDRLFDLARRLRHRYFGEKIFFYGFVYFSTYCKNDCAFCLYRTSNRSLVRYRKDQSEILAVASALAELGVHLLDLTMGEDPFYLLDEHGVDKLLGLVNLVKKESGLPLMVSPGVVSTDTLKELYGLGVNWYACYQETHNRQLYQELRIGQDYDQRWHKKQFARNLGMLTEEGIMTGVGETLDDVANSLAVMARMGAEQVRVMSFIPQSNTPMQRRMSPERNRELLTIAVMRLLFPDRLIPASLDVDGIDGLRPRLDAGANVVTSIIPARSGLTSVSSPDLDIDDGNRTVKRVSEVLAKINLEPASQTDYYHWVCQRQRQLKDGINECSRILA